MGIAANSKRASKREQYVLERDLCVSCGRVGGNADKTRQSHLDTPLEKRDIKGGRSDLLEHADRHIVPASHNTGLS